MREKILQLVIETVKEINADLHNENLENPNMETSLYGVRGNLDSLGLVNLIADLEQRISDDINQDLILADERAMSLRHSPFRTISSLTDYIMALLEPGA